MAWIKFEKDLLTDPRVLRIAKSLQARWMIFDHKSIPSNEQFDGSNASALPAVTLVVGALIRIWSLADTHLDSDDLLPLGTDELDDVVGVPGFCALLPFDWLVPVGDNTVKLPEFHIHNGTEAKKKAVTQKRVERFRSRNATALPSVTHGALPDQTRPDQTKTRRKTKPNGAAQARFALPDWVPSEPWEAWIEVRTKLKAPNTHRALSIAVKDLDDLRSAGHEPQAVLELATIRGWRGLFAPKQNGADSAPPDDWLKDVI